MEENSLLLQVARALASVDSNQIPETKARLSFTGNTALELLREKYQAQPDIIANLMDPDAYLVGEWKEITRFIGQYKNYINNETLDQWSHILNSQLHLSLVSVYWPSFRYIENMVKNQNHSSDSSHCVETQSHYDKCIKLIRSAQYILNLSDYERNAVFQKINKEYPNLIETMSLFNLLFTSSIQLCEGAAFKKIQLGIAHNSLRILQYRAEQKEMSEDDKIIFENIVSYKDFYMSFLGKENTNKALQFAYQGLIIYYESIDDMDNLYKIQSKKEILDMSV